MSKKCLGCGIELQSESSKEAGYVPASVIMEQSEPICQRCFKIKNYGAYIPVNIENADYKHEVVKVIKDMDAVLLLVDIIEFEASFDKEILDLIRGKKVIAAINKIDLIPGEKHPSEVSEWVKVRLFKENIQTLDVAILSVKNKYGVNGIIKKFRHFYPDGAKIAVIGTTNVGKSSLINSLFKKERATVSKYPGTTLKTIKHTIKEYKLSFFDTPGIIPHGRISDLVCEECNLKIVPSNEISRKTFKLGKDRILMFGGLAWIKVLTDAETKPIFSAYASKQVVFHETNEEKVEELLEKRSGEMLSPPCEHCKEQYYENNFKKEIVEIETNEELVLKGLGWITVKRGPLKVEVTLPESASITIRDAFIEPKRPEDMY